MSYNKELRKSLQFSGGCCDEPQTAAQVPFPGGFASDAPVAGQAAIKAPTARILVEVDCGQYQANLQGRNQQDQYRYVAMQLKELWELFTQCAPRKRGPCGGDLEADDEALAREIWARVRERVSKVGVRHSYRDDLDRCVEDLDRLKSAVKGVCVDLRRRGEGASWVEALEAAIK